MDAERQVLPRGRHAASREVVERSQRDRLLEATAAAVAERGYASTSVADVLVRAGVSRKTFYEHFANKEACFLAAFELGVDRVMAAIDAEIAAAEHPFEAAVRGTGAYLDWLGGNPAWARTFLIEVLAAGPAALERRSAVHERFAEQYRRIIDAAREVLPELPEHPPARYRACVGATNELVSEHVRRHGVAGLREAVAGPMVDVQLGLLVGDELAARLRPPA